MLLSPRKNGLTSLFKEVRVFKPGFSWNSPWQLPQRSPKQPSRVFWLESPAWLDRIREDTFGTPYWLGFRRALSELPIVSSYIKIRQGSTLVAGIARCHCQVRCDSSRTPPNRTMPKTFFGGVLRGNTIRGNRPERFWEGNLPLKGSLRGPLRGMVSEVFRGF